MRNEKISYKIREFSLRKIPKVLVLGKAEMKDEQVSVRSRGSNKTATMGIKEFKIDVMRELGLSGEW